MLKVSVVVKHELMLTLLIVIKQCGLERDLSLWEAGDQTEVGERGVTLRYVKFLSEHRIVD